MDRRRWMVGALAVVLAACGGGDDDNAGEASGSGSGVEETTTTEGTTAASGAGASSQEEANELLDLFPQILALDAFINESQYLTALDARDFDLLSTELAAIVDEIVAVADALDAVELTDPELQRARDAVTAAYDDLISSMETVAQAGSAVTEEQLNVLADALDGYGPPVREFGRIVEAAAAG